MILYMLNFNYKVLIRCKKERLTDLVSLVNWDRGLYYMSTKYHLVVMGDAILNKI